MLNKSTSKQKGNEIKFEFKFLHFIAEKKSNKMILKLNIFELTIVRRKPVEISSRDFKTAVESTPPK